MLTTYYSYIFLLKIGLLISISKEKLISSVMRYTIWGQLYMIWKLRVTKHKASFNCSFVQTCCSFSPRRLLVLGVYIFLETNLSLFLPVSIYLLLSIYSYLMTLLISSFPYLSMPVQCLFFLPLGAFAYSPYSLSLMATTHSPTYSSLHLCPHLFCITLPLFSLV